MMTTAFVVAFISLSVSGSFFFGLGLFFSSTAFLAAVWVGFAALQFYTLAVLRLAAAVHPYKSLSH